MSVRHQSQDHIRSTYKPSGGNHLLLHRAVVASTSLLALSAALGWSDPALAVGTCGAPTSGVANCGNTNYPTGIEYAGADGVDDLTVNVGSFAGQNAAVTVTGGITVENMLSTSNSSQTVNVGSNVTISGLDGIEVVSQSGGTKAVDSIYNGASISALAGIYSVVSDQDGSGNATGSGSITNTGNIDALIGIEQRLLVLGYSASHNEKVSATSTVSNQGKISAYAGIDSVIETQAVSKVGIAAVTANSTVNNSGKIKTTGGLGYGIGSYVEATAEGALGASMSAYSTVQNSGDIGTSGASAAGIVALSRGEGISGGSTTGIGVAAVYNSGNVKTTGATAYTVAGGFKYYNHGADALVAVSYMAALGSKGGQSVAEAIINNSGALSTSGTLAHGIYAASKSIAVSSDSYNDSSTAYATVQNAGAIKTKGAGATGIYASSDAIAGLDPNPSNAYYGTAKAVTSVLNSGAIKTTGGEGYTVSGGVKTYHGADGIYASSSSVGGGVDGARSTATTYVGNTGPIKTSGAGAAGIDANAQGVGVGYFGFVTGGAYVTVVNSGAITTKGAGAAGILATSTGAAYGLIAANAYAYSTATVKNGGAIKTSGDGSDGIAAVSKGLASSYFASVYTNATAINAGTIATKGADSIGIYAYAASKTSGLLSAPYANANAVNTGSVTTTGAGAAGIVAASGTYSAGEFIYSAARSTITNTGSVTTSGLGAAGLYADSISSAASPGALSGDGNGKTYAASTITTTGSVATSGDGAVGAAALASAKSYSVYYSHAHSVTSVTNAGSITTKGTGAYGIVSKATATAYTPAASIYQSIATASSTVLNAGVVSASGAGANGIVAYTKASAIGTASGASANATTMVTNAGSVTSAQGVGILAYSAAYASSGSNASAKASSEVINAGSVLASGPGGIGVFAASLAGTNTGAVPSSATVVNAAGGSIAATGAGGIGVKAEAAYTTVATYAGSTITGGTGAGAVGVYESGALNIVSNAGSIGSGNDHAIQMEGLAANIIKNNGTITGYVTMHGTGPAEQNVFYNYGTWVARGGNSDFAHTAGGGSNLVNEGTGTIIVVGTQSFTNLDKFTNVGGLITMTQAASAGLGTRPAFETLTVSGDYEGLGGVLAVDASTVGGMNGDVLNIKGEASGLTDVKATILGTPGPTTGNGILVVKAHATAAAGTEFVLDGNANGGHSEVAGAFEYNLDFVPGAGTSGDWYLKSAVYPGVSQFGQVGSSTALIADQVNPELLDLMNQVMDGEMKSASLDSTSQVASVDSSFVPSPNDPGGSAWGRFDEARFNVDPSGSSLSNYKLRVDSAQIGLDYDWHNAANAMLIGGYVTPFHAWSDFSTNGAHITTSGTAYGIYGLWFSGPWQAGLRLNMDSDTAFISDTNIGTKASTKPDEKGAQAAVSYDMPLDWGADFTPSAEVNYAKIDGVHFTDGAGDPVQVSSTNDFWGKINGRLSTDVMTDRGLLVQPYVNIGLLYRGDTSSRVIIDDFSSATNVNGWNGDFAVGVNTNLAANLSLSAQADYIAGNRVDGWSGFIGLRYTPGAVEAPPPPPPMAPPPPPPPPPPTKTFIVFFDFNKSNLTAEAQSVVSEAVKTAKESGMVRVLVTGHTDTVGSDSYNMGLSVRRAQSVKDEMVRQGIDGSGISIEGKGFHDPLVPTGPGVREPQNRRAVIDLGG